MKLYENIFIGRQDLSQQQMEALGVNLCLFVTQNGGEVVRSEYCGLKNLAYLIKKNQKGHYYVIQFKGEAALVKELDRIMRINEDIIRFSIIKVDAFETRENLIVQAKTYMDDSMYSKDGGYRNTSNRDVERASEGEIVDEVVLDIEDGE